ncbi:MAG: hypothetical protein GX604_00735 [Actinobacteria bacterium]|nr:hypothetical protein [Actinomycetota bacterium]
MTRKRAVPGILITFLLFGVLVAGLAGCTKAGELPKDAVAMIGQNIITQAQFDTRMAEIEKQYGGQVPTKDGDEAMYKEFQTMVLNYMVEVDVVAQSAAKMDITVTDDEIQSQIDGIKQMYMDDDAAFETALKDQNLTLDSLKKALREQELTRKVFDAVTEEAVVTPEQVENYYHEHQEDFTVPESRLTRHILFMPKNADDSGGVATDADWATALSLAEKVRKEIVEGADFAEKAKQHSDDPGSKDLGGDLGEVQKGTMVAEFEEATFTLKKFDISEPIKTQFGYHLIQVTDITDSQVVTLDEVEDHITEIVLQQEQKKMWDAWLVKTKEELGVQYKPGFELVTTTTVTTLVTDPETTSTTKE